MNINKTVITATLIILMSSTAAALIEPDWPMDKPNERLHPSDLIIDFEGGTSNERPVPDVPGVRFVDHLGYPWVYAEKGCPRMNIFPNIWNPGHEYIVNGGFGAFTCWAKIPHYMGVIEFDGGANHVSVLASCGCDLRMTAYDKAGTIIDRCTCEPNTGTLTFTRMTVGGTKSNIQSVEFYGVGNFWIIDEVIIGGLTFPDEPVNYTDVARLAQELHGVDYLEYGVGHDYLTFEYLDPWQFGDGIDEKYWNPETKTFENGEGIGNAGLIVWAYNKVSKELYDESIVKHCTVAKMEKHDFTVDVDSADTQPGDVCFMDRRDRNGDYGSDGYADEVYMVVEETATGMDLITSCPDENIGVIYSKKSISESSPAFMGYKRLPGVIRGGHNPIPKGH